MVKSQTVNITITAPAPPAPAVSSISITPSATSGTTGQSVTVSGVVLDQYGSPMGSVALYLFVNGVQQGSAVSDSSGKYSFSISFPNAGAFAVDVSDSVNNQ